MTTTSRRLPRFIEPRKPSDGADCRKLPFAMFFAMSFACNSSKQHQQM
jgi:hypothetical protein